MPQDHPHVLIIGAGSMGLIVGYHLSLGGTDVSFLVRPHHIETLSRPQILYCYGDDSLKEFKDYSVISDPQEMRSQSYDFIYVTLDAASLQNDVGQSLVKTIGEVAYGTETKVILGSVSIDLRTWFLQISGLPGDQVTNGHLKIHAYAPKVVTLPVHPPTSPEKIAQADLAYIDCLGEGLVLYDDSPAVANFFSEIYNACKVSRSAVEPAAQGAVSTNPIFAIFILCNLMDWPKFKDIRKNDKLWSLTVAAVKEIQRLGIHGEVGQAAANATTEDGLATALAGWEGAMLPLDLQEFNRFHHGRKVSVQDKQHIQACISYGEKEGKPMSALKELVGLMDHH